MNMSREDERKIEELTKALLNKNIVLEQMKKTVESDKFDLSRLKPTDHARKKELEEEIKRYQYTEIPKIGIEISNIEDQISKIRDDNRKREEEVEKEVAKKREPQEKEWQINRLKKIYKSGPKFDRFMYFVLGRAPRWGKIKDMSLDELKYMEKTAKGETFFTRGTIDIIEENGKQKNQTYSEIEKRKKDYKWGRFVSSLQELDQTKKNTAFEVKRGSL